MFGMFACCVSDQEKYKSQVDDVSENLPTFNASQEVTELLASDPGKLALYTKFFNEEQARIMGYDLLEEVMLSDKGLLAFENKVIDSNKILSLLKELSEHRIPAVNVFGYLISDEGQERLKSGDLAWNNITKEFAPMAIKFNR